MKFRHQFQLTDQTASSRVYRADNSTVRLDFFAHMLRVAILRDGAALLPTFTVCPQRTRAGYGICNLPAAGRDKLSAEGFLSVSPEITEDEKELSFSIDDVTFHISLFNFRLSASTKNGLLFSDRAYISYNFDHELGDGSAHFITREPDEKIFGMGDKTGPVNKNGMSFRMGASDAMGFDARSSDPLYKQLPFYICENTNGSYGIYYDTYSSGELNFGKEINNYYAPFKSFRCEEENLVYYVILGNVPQIVTRFSAMCGMPLFPPKWTFLYTGSTMSYTDAPDADAKLRAFLELCDTHRLHPGGFYLSSGYTQIGDKRYVFHWNTDKIPSPETLSSHFKAHGVEFLPNVKPCFLINHPLYQEIAEKGWFLHYANGTPAIFPFWDDYGSYLDFTNPDAYSFWTDCVRTQLVEKGYRNIWNDNNEYDICDKEVYAHGFGAPVQACLIRPLFSFLMTMASLSAQDSSVRTVSVSRCGIGGLGRIATTWTGDNNTAFSDFRYNHKMAMTMSLSGFFNFGQDIGGFAGERPCEELFLRWIQYGIFTPRFVLHSWNPDGIPTMPWLYPDLMPAVQRLFALRDALVPYLYNEAYRSAEKNEPIIYPVFLNDPDYDVESDAFFCGDSILSVPIFDEGASSVSVMLPTNSHLTAVAGGAVPATGYLADAADGAPDTVWYRDLPPQLKTADDSPVTAYYHANGQPLVLDCKAADLPVFLIKGGSVIPWATDMRHVRQKTLDGIAFTVYPPVSGSFTFRYLLDDGVSWLTDENHEIITFSITCEPDAVTISVSGTCPPDIRMTDALRRKLIVLDSSHPQTKRS